MRCDEVMQTDLKSLAPTEIAKAAAIRMRDENIGFLPVCTSEGRVLGTLTDRDIAIRVERAGAVIGALFRRRHRDAGAGVRAPRR